MAAVGKLATVLVLLFCAVLGGVQAQNDSLVMEGVTKLMAAGFSNILGVIEGAGLTDDIAAFIESGNKVTAFLPKNNFFPDYVDTGLLAYLQQKPDVLREVLKFHLVPNNLLKRDGRPVSPPFVPFSDGASYSTFNEKAQVKISFDGRKRKVEQSFIRFPDAVVLRESLVVHGINGLLIPSYLADSLPLSKESCKSLGTCPPSVQSLVPSPAPSESPSSAPAPAPSAESNIIIAALIKAQYTQLAQLITSLNLVGYVDALLPGPVTVLAPDNAAFAGVLTPNFTTAARSNPAIVRAILDLHVIQAAIVTYKVINKDLSYRNLANQTLYFKYNAVNGTSTVALASEPLPGTSPANIYSTPILEKPGMVSVLGIDQVLRPPNGVAPPPESSGVRLGQGLATILIAMLCFLMV